MQLIKSMIRKHPYFSILLLWLYAFCVCGRFQIEDVSSFNYFSVLLFGTVLLLAEKKYISRQTEDKKLIEEDFKKTAILVGIVGGYTMLTLYVFSLIPYTNGLKGRNPLVILVSVWVLLAAAAVYLSVRKKWSYRAGFIMIFVGALAIHAYYMLYSGMLYQWDQGEISGSGNGHLGYIAYLYQHGLPAQFDPREKWQYYHPPLNHYLSAGFLRLQTLCGVNMNVAVYNVTFMPLLYYMITAYTFFCIGKESGLKKPALLLAEAVVVFCCALTSIGCYVNNDMLSIMFSTLALYFTMRWNRSRTAKNILKVALCFGLGMFTKLSVWMIAVPIAVFFLSALLSELKKKAFGEFRRLFGQMCAFLGVAVPLSFYWSIRNYVRFGMPIGYVPVNNDDTQLISESVTQRLFDFNLSQFRIPWVGYVRNHDPFNEYNPLIALVKSSTITTHYFPVVDHIALWVTVVMCILSFVCMIGCLIRKNTLPPLLKTAFAAMYFVYMLCYYFFCIRYPHVCTEDIRYAAPVIFLGALFTTLTVQHLSESEKRPKKILGTAAAVMTVLYCVTSALMIVTDGVCLLLFAF